MSRVSDCQHCGAANDDVHATFMKLLFLYCFMFLYKRVIGEITKEVQYKNDVMIVHDFTQYPCQQVYQQIILFCLQWKPMSIDIIKSWVILLRSGNFYG